MSPLEPTARIVRWMRTEPVTPEATPDGGLVVRVRPPEARPPAVLDATTKTKGERVVLMRPDAWCYDLRAASDPYQGADGLVVQIVAEAHWYRWQITGEPMEPVEVLASVVFLERPPA